MATARADDFPDRDRGCRRLRTCASGRLHGATRCAPLPRRLEGPRCAADDLGPSSEVNLDQRTRSAAGAALVAAVTGSDDASPQIISRAHRARPRRASERRSGRHAEREGRLGAHAGSHAVSRLASARSESAGIPATVGRLAAGVADRLGGERRGDHARRSAGRRAAAVAGREREHHVAVDGRVDRVDRARHPGVRHLRDDPALGLGERRRRSSGRRASCSRPARRGGSSAARSAACGACSRRADEAAVVAARAGQHLTVLADHVAERVHDRERRQLRALRQVLLGEPDPALDRELAADAACRPPRPCRRRRCRAPGPRVAASQAASPSAGPGRRVGSPVIRS